MVDRLTYEGVPSRFEALIVQTSFLDAILKTKTVTHGTNEHLRTVLKKSKDHPLKGSIANNKMYSGKLTFAPAYHDSNVEYGSPWSEPLPNPVHGKEYLVSLEISQLQGDGPLSQLQGFKTYWTHPPGWVWADGHAGTIYDEAVTNPLFVRRVVKAPSTIGTQGFKVEVQAVYRP